MATLITRSTYLNFEWPFETTARVGGLSTLETRNTARSAGLSKLEATATTRAAQYSAITPTLRPSILTINGVQNLNGATPFELIAYNSVDLVVTGMFMDSVTSMQFEPYGPSNTTPSPTPTGPLVPVTPITGFVLNGIDTITLSNTIIDAAITAGDLVLGVWYKLVLNYNEYYQPPYIQAQTAKLQATTTAISAQLATLYQARFAGTAVFNKNMTVRMSGVSALTRYDTKLFAQFATLI